MKIMKQLSEKSKKQVCVKMDNGIAKRLKKLADAAHRSLSAQIVFILEQGLTNLSPEEKAIISED